MELLSLNFLLFVSMVIDKSTQCITLTINFCEITAKTNKLIDKIFVFTKSLCRERQEYALAVLLPMQLEYTTEGNKITRQIVLKSLHRAT